MPRPRASAPRSRKIAVQLTEEEGRRLDALVAEQGHKNPSALVRSWLGQKYGPNEIQFTDDEERRLDNLVAEHGFENRMALLRAWINQIKPVPEAILRRCTPTAKTLFAFVLDEAHQRRYTITWYPRGFWVDAKNFAWTMSCNEPNRIEFDFRKVAERVRLHELITDVWDSHRSDEIHLSINDSNVVRVRDRIVSIFDTGTATEPKDLSCETQLVCDAVRQNRNARTGSVCVPKVVRAVERLLPAARVHAVLRRLAERGMLELPPDLCG